MLVVLALLAACSTPAPTPAAPKPKPIPPAHEEPPSPEPPPAPNRPPVVKKLAIDPTHPTSQDDIQAVVEAVDPEGLPVRVRYRWYLNGHELLSERANHLDHVWFNKGDKVELSIIADDGTDQVTQKLPAVTIADAPPEMLIRPDRVDRIDGLQVRARDPDHDPITWRIEGAPRGMTIDPKRGILHYRGSEDEPGGKYDIKVIADDGDGGTATWQFEVRVTPGSKAAEHAQKKAEQAKKAGG